MKRRKSLTDVMCVDVGTFTGYAFWDSKDFRNFNFHSFTCDKGILGDGNKRENLYCKFELLLAQFNPKIVYIEGVEIYSESNKSMAAAARGNLMFISYLAGGYEALANRRNIETRIIKPRTWKGQLNKKAVQLRVERKTGLYIKSDHEADAVGMGLSLIGEL